MYLNDINKIFFWEQKIKNEIVRKFAIVLLLLLTTVAFLLVMQVNATTSGSS